MELNFEEIFNKTSDLNPLKISFLKKTTYFEDFVKLLVEIGQKMTEEDINDLLFNKLQLGKSTFNEIQYYQYATELCVIFHSYCLNKNDFHYEKVVRDDVDPKKGKQPECTVKVDKDFIYNVEAKNPERTIRKEPDKNQEGIFISSVGRANSKIDADNLFYTLKNELETSNNNLQVISLKNNDNKLKDYLYSAGEKFPINFNPNEVNILFVSLETVYEIQEYVNFLVSNQGLFTKQSFAEQEKYKNVDLLIFTNSYYRQKNNEKINGSAWWLNDGFNFITVNPNSRYLEKLEAVTYFCNNISNFNKQIETYKVPASPETPKDLLNSFVISSFVKEKLEKQDNIYLFEKK